MSYGEARERNAQKPPRAVSDQNILSAKRYRCDEATGPGSGRLRERVAAIAVFVLIVDFVESGLVDLPLHRTANPLAACG